MKIRFRPAMAVLALSALALAVLYLLAAPSSMRARVAPPPRRPGPVPVVQGTPAVPPATSLPTPARLPRQEALRSLGYVAGFDEREAPEWNTEAYDRIVDNAFQAVSVHPLSTFSVDVDTASYANVRRFLLAGSLPPKDAVRIEELVNYFRFAYPEPVDGAPFAVYTEVAACPWSPRHRLVQVGIQARRIPADDLPARNLVFLLDVSGSMAAPNKLPLVRSALSLLVDQLTERDRVAIVVYAGAAGLVLPPTPGDRHGEIRAALSRLQAGGSTAGGAGLQLAYRVAEGGFVEGGVNRVVLATDGDFNVGTTSRGGLDRLVEEKRRTGVSLSVLGFGMGNLKDSTLEALSARGDGNYAYIDSLQEARKVLVEEAGGTLVTVARDVKVQVEFNPRSVAAYRLLGYENRRLADTDFNDDAKDAGDVGAGHSVTAFYEVVPAGQEVARPGLDPLRYQEERAPSVAAGSGELLTLKVRYKEPEGGKSRLLATAVADAGGGASEALRFAAAVAAFGMVLRDSEHKGEATYTRVLEWAEGAGAGDEVRAEFVRLVQRARTLDASRVAQAAR